MKFKVFGQAVFILNSCGGDKGNADPDTAKFFSFMDCLPVAYVRFKNKRVWSCCIFSHYLSISRNRRFKDIGIYTLMFQEAICAFLSFEGTDNAAKCVAKSAAESRAVVRWEEKCGFGCDRKDIFRKVESFQAAAPNVKE